MVALITERNELYRKFGPKLIEAQTKLILKQLNTIRLALHIPLLTLQDLTDCLEDELTNTADYTWSKKES